jgi:hypothetical protein
LFDRQKRTFASGVTRTYDWRVDQLDRMAKMITENEDQLQTAIRVGSSGMGHYYGKYGYDSFTHAKSRLVSPPDVAIKHLLPPYTAEKNSELKMWFEY